MNKLREAIAEIICQEANSAFYMNTGEEYDEFIATSDDYEGEANAILSLVLKELLEGKPEKMTLTKDETNSDWFYGLGNNRALEAFENHIKNKLGGDI